MFAPRLLAAAALLLVSVPAAWSQSTVPDLDMTQTCKASGTGTEPGRTNDACLRDENGARQQLQGLWAKVPGETRRSCLDEVRIGGSPSYVELLTCAQMNEWSKEEPNPTAPGQVSNPNPTGTTRP